MRVLVTGAAGFTGRFLMAFLAAQGGVKPVGLVRSPAGTRAGETGSFVVADLRDRAALDAALATNRPDAIIHLAGMTRGEPGSAPCRKRDRDKKPSRCRCGCEPGLPGPGDQFFGRVWFRG